ncbi:hypothetical protein MMC18_000836 [Xylographa bjoerkii]|nr:hypothetical protein [Xylographa bjoerkii]
MASTNLATTGPPISVLFVCLGNICELLELMGYNDSPDQPCSGRSPMGEAVFRHRTSSDPRVRLVESAGTESYNVGNSPDERTMSVLQDKGIVDYSHVARKVRRSDFTRFDYILAMDRSNLRDLQVLRQRVATKGNMDKLARVVLFGDYGDENGEEIIDPWYGEQWGFEVVYEQLVRFSDGFVKKVLDVDREN